MERDEDRINRIIAVLEPIAKFWNQNSLFLIFGGSFAVMFSAGMELFKIWAKDYQFQLENIKMLFSDWYFIGIFCFFLLGLAFCIFSSITISRKTKDVNTTLKVLQEHKNKLKMKSKF